MRKMKIFDVVPRLLFRRLGASSGSTCRFCTYTQMKSAQTDIEVESAGSYLVFAFFVGLNSSRTYF